jgi:hypothetical protein
MFAVCCCRVVEALLLWLVLSESPVALCVVPRPEVDSGYKLLLHRSTGCKSIEVDALPHFRFAGRNFIVDAHSALSSRLSLRDQSKAGCMNGSGA